MRGDGTMTHGGGWRTRKMRDSQGEMRRAHFHTTFFFSEHSYDLGASQKSDTCKQFATKTGWRRGGWVRLKAVRAARAKTREDGVHTNHRRRLSCWTSVLWVGAFASKTPSSINFSKRAKFRFCFFFRNSLKLARELLYGCILQE